jgi:DNA-binding winged helix-turn-helix (wHTH) protein/Tol biopolymer transport system component
MSLPQKDLFAFNCFVVDPGERMLLRDGAPVPLEPKVFDTLLVLMRHSGRLVSKEELMRAVWPDSFVEESNLTRNVSVLRKALGRSDPGPQYIETVSKRGYRFACEVRELPRHQPGGIVAAIDEEAPLAFEPDTSAARRRVTPRRLIGALWVVGAVLVGGFYLFAEVRQPGPANTSTPAQPGPMLQDLQVTQLTTSGNADRPAISPDGRYVAYVRSDGTDDSVWIRQTATNSHVQVVGPASGQRVIGVTVTPDGNFIDFVRGRERQFALWRVPYLGGASRKVLDDVHTPIGWSPDGTHGAFIRRDQARGSSSLTIVDADGTHERSLYVRRDPALFTNVLGAGFPGPRPAWSPDNGVIAVPGYSPAETLPQVLFLDVRTGSARTVPLPAEVGSATLGLAWRDNSSLMLTPVGPPGSPSQLWQLSYPDGRLSRVTNDVNSYLRVSVTADRDSLVTARSEIRGGLWIADGAGAHGADVVPLSPATMAYGGIAWTTDHLLYVTTGNGPPAIVRLIRGDATEEVMSSALAPVITPDGQTLVVSSRAVGTQGVLSKASVDGHHRVKLADGHSHIVTPDGRAVLFISMMGGLQSPWIVPLEGGEPRQFVKLYAGAQSLAVSPDGRSLAFWSQDDQNKRTLRTCTLPACGELRSLAVPPSQRRLLYTPDGRAIAYLDPAMTNIWLLPLAGGRARQLTHFAPGPTISDFAWSRDGKRLAVLRFTVANDIVMFRGLRDAS